MSCVCCSASTTPFKSLPVWPTRAQVTFIFSFLFLPEEKNQTNTSRLCPYLTWLGVFSCCLDTASAVKRRNSPVFIAAVMQCSFFSALQFHSHSRLPGSGDGRYWAEKLRQFLLAQEQYWHGPCFEEVTAVSGY